LPAMDTSTLIIPKPTYNILRRLTGQSRPDVALSMVIKDVVRLRMEAARSVIHVCEQKYHLSFKEFETQWQAGQIPKAYSYDVEKDYQEWEAAITDLAALEELSTWLV